MKLNNLNKELQIYVNQIWKDELLRPEFMFYEKYTPNGTAILPITVGANVQINIEYEEPQILVALVRISNTYREMAEYCIEHAEKWNKVIEEIK